MKRSLCICLVLITFVFVKATPSTHPYAYLTKERFKRDESCLAKVNIDRKVVDMAVAAVGAQNIPNEDQKYKEYLSCSYKQLGFQGEDGVIQYNRIIEFLSKYYEPSDLMGIKNCLDIGNTHEDKAFETLLCVIGYLRTVDIKP